LEFAIRKCGTDPSQLAVPALLRPASNRTALHVSSSPGLKKHPNLTLAHCARESRGRSLWTIDVEGLARETIAMCFAIEKPEQEQNVCAGRAAQKEMKRRSILYGAAEAAPHKPKPARAQDASSFGGGKTEGFEKSF
jgi:hypothetical protein